ncbi:hypothetical protein ACHAXR_011475 [Thalassiosira sp. AJA248-18]
MNRAVAASVFTRLTRASTKVAVPSSTWLPISCSPAAAASPILNNSATTTSSHQQSSRRQLSSNKPANVTAAAADRRLAGRRRFYKNVGIAACSPPEKPTKKKTINGSSSSSSNDATSVASPISAGVDGTQSATGVSTTIPDSDRWSSLLTNLNSNSGDSVSTSNSSATSWHTVTLDNRPLRTPLGLPLTLPSPTLALAIASEWDSQKTYLQPAQMPLMTLACTAIDQVASNPTMHQIDVMRYLANDTSCYWVDPSEDRVLHRRQSKAWEGLHSSLSKDLLGLSNDLGPAQSMGGGWEDALILSRRSKGNPTSGLPHPPLLVEKAQQWVNSLDAWTLVALYSACAESKSFFIGAALIHEAMKVGGGGGGEGEGAAEESSVGSSSATTATAVRDGKWAATASRVEEEFNIECWGLVEGGHDYDRLNCSIQMHAASFLAQAVRL